MLKRKSVIKGDTLHYTVSAEGFYTVTDEVVVLENSNIVVELQPKTQNTEYELTIEGITSSNYIGVAR